MPVNPPRVLVHRDRYRDSLLLLSATAAMSEIDGVDWAAAVMAAPPGLATLTEAGVADGELAGLSANDLVLAVRATEDAIAEEALRAGTASAFPADGAPTGEAHAEPQLARTVREAAREAGDATVAIVSVPGPYAALEAHHALSAGLHVLLFSDNVPLEEEIELKRRGADLGLLLMGPGAGTAVLAGTGLGFANAVRRGPVGVVAAAGTGAQEVACLLDRWGVGVSQVIGVGGRDLSEQVGGEMARLAVRTLAADPDTGTLLLVSKPPDAEVARAVLAEAGDKPTAAVLIGLEPAEARLIGVEPAEARLIGLDAAEAGLGSGGTVCLAPTLEQGAVAAARLAGASPPPLADGLAERVASACRDLPARRRLVRGYFSGGTLCYETQVILTGLIGPVYSNEPLDGDRRVPAPPGSHVCLDLGAEEYTRGRPHPMIDPTVRRELLVDRAADAEAGSVAVILLDVVLGFGSHPDPAGVLAPVCAELMAGGGPVVVAYVLGASADPQDFQAQRRTLTDAGCIVPQTSARGAYAAAALALRRPELAEAGL
jgi:FdrA protein